MIRKRLGRLASISTSAALALMLLGVGTASATPPGWEFLTPANLAPEVGTSRLAAWSFTIHNGGNSNISKLYLTDSLGTEEYNVSADRAGCVTAPVLYCDFGALAAGASIFVRVVHTAPDAAGDFPVTFQLNGSGETYSDGKGKSHGDTKSLYFDGVAGADHAPVTVVRSSTEFDGGFAFTSGTIFSTTGALTRQNPQTSSVVAPISLSAVTIQDIAGSISGDPCGTNGFDCIGQWTRLSAPTADNARIKVTLIIRGKGLPGSVGAEDIVVYHEGEDGLIGEGGVRCTSATDSASAPCIYVTQVGGNFQVVVWLTHNGGLRGGY